MNKLKKQHVKYLMPTICDTLDMSKRDKKIRVTITCVTQAPIDNNKGEDYLGAYINASLHSINGSGNEETKNPPETDGRKEWDSCYHFTQEYSSFHSGDWSIWLHLHARYDVKDDEDIDYAIAITIEDLTQSLQLYDNIVLEAKNRFRPVSFVRLPVRPY